MAVKKTSRSSRRAVCAQCGASFHPLRGATRASRYCSYPCSCLGRRLPLAERLNARVDTLADPAACWLWKGTVNNMGYGRLGSGGRGGRGILAHRAAWEQANGPIPEGLNALHRCDTPRCCNPEHLFLGTKADNTHDAMAKGRFSIGEHRPNTRLTEGDVREIRVASGTHEAIAAKYGVARPTVTLIRNRRIWRHVN